MHRADEQPGRHARRARHLRPRLSAQLVDDALARLTEGHGAVLEQVYILDRSVAEAARVLDLPIGTVKSRAFYALPSRAP